MLSHQTFPSNLVSDAFKEQLKSDEASKNKAEKKAKKELEDERNKPVSVHFFSSCKRPLVHILISRV